MAQTTHGHHIPGTPLDEDKTHFEITACGGILNCPQCKDQSVLYWQSMRAEDFIGTAKKLVTDYVDSHLDKSDEPPVFEVYVVIFTKTLQHWKAHLSTTLPDGMYYELTFNGDKNEVYFDAYKKFDHKVISLGG